MAIVLLLFASAMLVWGYFYAQRANLSMLAVATVLMGYVLGHSFWHVDLGPVTLTLDRLMLVGLAGLFGWRLWKRRVLPSAISGVDWALAITLVWLTVSALVNRPGDEVLLPKSPFWRLLVSFWAPAVLYLVTRQSMVDRRVARWILASIAVLGTYLALTAIAETAGWWSVVFPRFIADSTLGLHFGRARGPGLNSVSLGVYLSVCFWAAWLLLPKLSRPWQVAVAATLPLMAFAVLLTYTRSTWIGLAASGFAVLAVQLPRRLRLPVLGGVTIVGLFAAGLLWQSMLYLEREDSGQVSHHSVQQRTAFAYVSWNMFRDNPLAGVGFGRFYDQKLPYLADRSQTFELESLRDLHHHNTFLGLLTETGLVGLVAYTTVLIGFLSCGWGLAGLPHAAPHERSLGVLLVATVMVYLPSALFHDLTHVHPDQWLLFVIGGLAVGCERRLAYRFAASPATVGAKSSCIAVAS